MGKGNLHIRHQFLELCCYFRDIIHSVIHIVNLPAAGHFSPDRFFHQLLIIFHNISLNGTPVMRRFLQETHIPDSDQTHMKSPRNRRGRQRKHIHIFFHCFDLFFMSHSKPLFLINHQQTQIFILKIL